MIAVIRIGGLVKVKKPIAETLYRLRLRRKYSCILVDEKNKEVMDMVKKVKDYVAYGNINQETLVKLLKARMQVLDKKQVRDADVIAKEIINGKNLEELGLKSFFRLHPPRKGIKSKLHYPKGVLGDNKDDINKLIERML